MLRQSSSFNISVCSRCDFVIIIDGWKKYYILPIVYATQVTIFGMISQQYPKQKREYYSEKIDNYYRIIEKSLQPYFDNIVKMT